MGKNKNKGNRGSKKTYKAEIVQDYIKKYPNASTQSLARMVEKEFPADFNFDSARTMIRTYRDGLGGTHESLRTDEQKKFAMAGFRVPETDYKEVEHFIIPSYHNNLLLLSDVHVPYHDPEAVQIALDYGESKGMNAIYLNGDFMDCYMISRFTKDRRLRDMAGELEMVREFLAGLKERYDLPIYYKMGNHEDRWEIFLRNNAPELLNIPDFDLSKVLKFDEYNVTEIKSKQIAKAGKLNIMHGHEFGHSVFSPVSPSRGLYMRSKANAIIGHHHQTSEHTEKSLNDDIVTCWSTGALCGMKPDYMPFNKWNLGFAMVTFEDNGHFLVDNRKIIEGEVR